MNTPFWRGKKVFVTGHTGFKGSWLALWLHHIGAKVHGYSTAPPTEPNLFTAARVADCLDSHVLGDVRDLAGLKRAVAASDAEIVFHLAAQPIVRLSYQEPVETFDVNVMGTVNLLETLRARSGVRAIVNVTTDKTYASREWVWGYRETDRLGGLDPYASSKACSELVTSAYRSSYFTAAGVGLATARGGNVIGGGDWAMDRLIPDFFRSVSRGGKLVIRSPNATRPWQHVLDALSGYLCLAEAVHARKAGADDAWNFGPENHDVLSVRDVLDHLCRQVPQARWHHEKGAQVHETTELRLDSSKARAKLGWRSRWTVQTSLDRTVHWYQQSAAGADMHEVSVAQVDEYLASGAP